MPQCAAQPAESHAVVRGPQHARAERAAPRRAAAPRFNCKGSGWGRHGAPGGARSTGRTRRPARFIGAAPSGTSSACSGSVGRFGSAHATRHASGHAGGTRVAGYRTRELACRRAAAWSLPSRTAWGGGVQALAGRFNLHQKVAVNLPSRGIRPAGSPTMTAFYPASRKATALGRACLTPEKPWALSDSVQGRSRQVLLAGRSRGYATACGTASGRGPVGYGRKRKECKLAADDILPCGSVARHGGRCSRQGGCHAAPSWGPGPGSTRRRAAFLARRTCRAAGARASARQTRAAPVAMVARASVAPADIPASGVRAPPAPASACAGKHAAAERFVAGRHSARAPGRRANPQARMPAARACAPPAGPAGRPYTVLHSDGRRPRRSRVMHCRAPGRPAPPPPRHAAPVPRKVYPTLQPFRQNVMLPAVRTGERPPHNGLAATPAEAAEGEAL